MGEIHESTKSKTLHRQSIQWLCAIASILIALARAHGGEPAGLPGTIAKIKPAIVAIGTFQKTRRPPAVFRGTGFVIGDGHLVATNAHVIPEKIDQEKNEFIAVFAANANGVEIRQANVVGEDRDYDMTILRISGAPLAAMTLGNSDSVREGESYAFTGYPIGMVLGLHAVTHRGIVSAITPNVIPQLSGQQLEKKTLARLIAPYDVFQLDATAYPGNSGSPLYDPDTGHVVGILNKVFIQESKETVIQKPSGISYAIPIKHLQELLKKIRVE
jgi:S1-C subfamily serine protease